MAVSYQELALLTPLVVIQKLIENSIAAEAKFVDIYIDEKTNGCFFIKCVDNGHGILDSHRQCFQDKSKFLGKLASFAESLEISTKHANEVVGKYWVEQKHGNSAANISLKTKSMNRGTSIIVHELLNSKSPLFEKWMLLTNINGVSNLATIIDLIKKYSIVTFNGKIRYQLWLDKEIIKKNNNKKVKTRELVYSSPIKNNSLYSVSKLVRVLLEIPRYVHSESFVDLNFNFEILNLGFYVDVQLYCVLHNTDINILLNFNVVGFNSLSMSDVSRASHADFSNNINKCILNVFTNSQIMKPNIRCINIKSEKIENIDSFLKNQTLTLCFMKNLKEKLYDYLSKQQAEKDELAQHSNFDDSVTIINDSVCISPELESSSIHNHKQITTKNRKINNSKCISYSNDNEHNFDYEKHFLEEEFWNQRFSKTCPININLFNRVKTMLQDFVHSNNKLELRKNSQLHLTTNRFPNTYHDNNTLFSPWYIAYI